MSTASFRQFFAAFYMVEASEVTWRSNHESKVVFKPTYKYSYHRLWASGCCGLYTCVYIHVLRSRMHVQLQYTSTVYIICMRKKLCTKPRQQKVAWTEARQLSMYIHTVTIGSTFTGETLFRTHFFKSYILRTFWELAASKGVISGSHKLYGFLYTGWLVRMCLRVTFFSRYILMLAILANEAKSALEHKSRGHTPSVEGVVAILCARIHGHARYWARVFLDGSCESESRSCGLTLLVW